MKLNALSIASQKKLAHVGFKLSMNINEIQDMGNIFGFWMWTPLHFAASIGDLALIDDLLRHNADVNKPDGIKGATSIMYATTYGRAGATQLLLNRGASLQTKNINEYAFTREIEEHDALENAVNNSKSSSCFRCLWMFHQKNILGREVDYDKTIGILKKHNPTSSKT